MAYFEDLADYTYHPAGSRPGTKTVGWLSAGHPYKELSPNQYLLDLLWNYGSVSVAQMRGIHECELCTPPSTVFASRGESRNRLLGTSEIRVFSPRDAVYAAPSLIYHYVRTHHYHPPEEFLQAMEEGPKPPADAYFESLRRLDLTWNETSHAAKRDGFFRLERLPDGFRPVPVSRPVFLDES